MRWFLTAVLFAGLLCTVRSEETEEPTLSILARSTIYNIDETKAIFCEGHNLVEPIQWLKPTGEVVGVQTTNNKRIFVEQKGNGAVVPLIIHSIELDDAGNWTCRSGDLNETREFIVGQKVQFNVKNMSVEEEEGNSIKLPCEATGFPAPVVAWYKEKQLIKEQSRKYVIRQDHSLEIKKLNHADVGTYTCKVRQKVLSHYAEKTIQVSVQHKPLIIDKFNQVISGSIKYKTEEVYAILNDTKNVTCRSIANPPPTYTWNRRHDGYDDPPITDPDTVMTSEDGTSSVLILRLYNSSYFGEYKCTVANRKGTESIIYHVSAGTKPDPPDFVALVVANVTELTFNVSCSNCTYPTEADSVTSDPAMILGYSFQLVEVKPGYDPDWTISSEIEVDVVYDSTLYTVGPLKNGTKYHAQVRTRNAAGYSEWVDIPGEIVTLNHAIKLAATVLLVLVAILLPRLY